MKTPKIILTLMLIGLSYFTCAQKPVNQIIQRLKDPTSKEVMVVAHRGDWRNAPENSLQAIQNSIDMGLDMVEIDIRKTKDGHLVLMHDGTIDRTTNGSGNVWDWTLDSLKTLRLKNGLGRWTEHTIPTLEEAMVVAKGKILVNLDKCYWYFAEAYKILEKTGTTHQVVMKGNFPYEKVKKDFGQYLDKVYFMPIVDLDQADAWQQIQEYQKKLKPIAFELIFKTDTSAVLNRFETIQQNGSMVWVNSLWASLNAGYEDDQAVLDTQGIYGWYIQKGVNMIQTDRPRLLLDFLKTQGLHH